MTQEEPGREPVDHRRLRGVLFNSLSYALTAEQWMPLTERSRIADSMLAELLAHGLLPFFNEDVLRQHVESKRWTFPDQPAPRVQGSTDPSTPEKGSS